MGRKIIFAALALGAGLVNPGAALADTKAGVEAWTRGDYPAAVKEWQAQAARNDGDAIFNLGQAYKLGKGVKQDLVKAEQLFGQAATMGHLQAADNLGLLLFQRGERAQALPYIRAAADRGDPRAQYLAGIAHFNGDLVAKDWVRAYALVTLAQQQGLPQAAGALTQMNQYIPVEQRQQGVQLAGELASQADANRARQMAALDLGSQVAAPAQAAPMRAAGNSSPATAGADYARPAAAAPKLAAVSASAAAAVPSAVPSAVRSAVPAPAPAPAARSPVKAPPVPAPARAPAPAPVYAAGSWRVQLGAFGVASNADALWAKLRTRPELAGHLRLNVPAGTATKLQAGGYSQAAAQAACARLRSAGITCAAVPG